MCVFICTRCVRNKDNNNNRERKRKTKHINKKPRRHGKQVWYNEDCEVSRK